MNKFILLIFVFAFFWNEQTSAQDIKSLPPSNLQEGEEINLNILPWSKKHSLSGDNPFGTSPTTVTPVHSVPGVTMIMGDEGLPVSYNGVIPGSKRVNPQNVERLGRSYLEHLAPMGIKAPSEEFNIFEIITNELGYHVKFQQHLKGIPVYGSQIIVHTTNDVFAYAGGRYTTTPNLTNLDPSITEAMANRRVSEHIGSDQLQTEWSDLQLEMIGGRQFTSELIIYRHGAKKETANLAWKVAVHRNVSELWDYFIDAQTGEVLDAYTSRCNLMPTAPDAEKSHDHSNCSHARPSAASNNAANFSPSTPNLPISVMPTTLTGTDLNGQSHILPAFESGGFKYLLDATKPMFGTQTTTDVASMTGAIKTYDMNNTHMTTTNFIKTAGTSIDDASAVSAHVSVGLAYDYYKNTHARNSINGSGGTIINYINVADGNGASMQNAYWNGTAMFYGNGGTILKKLAGGLDVIGHEMSHGVVGNTAGLIYKDESGALNEHMADVFGIMIDRSDWTMGEDVTQPGATATGFLRDFSNPHNGGSSIYTFGWQPDNYSERYVGTYDNGGVHFNSGIANHAFYKFCTNSTHANVEAGKLIGEKMWYLALTSHLTATSKLSDLKGALEQVAAGGNLEYIQYLFAIEESFAAVGITGSNPGAVPIPLEANTGIDHIIAVSEDEQSLNLFSTDGILLEELYNGGVLDKPSTTDNGEIIVFVNHDNQIVAVEIAYNDDGEITFETGIVSQANNWRNVTISKDGRFLAALTTLNDNKIIFYDLNDPNGLTPKEYTLLNPTYVLGDEWTDNVKYADVMEFDYTGTKLMYDAFTEISHDEGEQGHWEVALMTFWEDGSYIDTLDIHKLVTGLADNEGVANPAFAKNSNNFVTYDYYEELADSVVTHSNYIADTHNGESGLIVSTGHEATYPGFTTHDDKILFQDKSILGGSNLRLQSLNDDMLSPLGSPSNLILAHKWGVWLNNGTRSITQTPTSIEEPDEISSFSVFPNPTSGQIQVTVSLKTNTTAKLKVSNLLGQVVTEREIQAFIGVNNLNLDLQDLPSGSYVVSLETNNNVTKSVVLVKE